VLTFEHIVVDKSQIARGTKDKRDEKLFRSRVSLVHVHSAATASARALGYAQVVHAVIQCYLRNFLKDARSIALPWLLSFTRASIIVVSWRRKIFVAKVVDKCHKYQKEVICRSWDLQISWSTDHHVRDKRNPLNKMLKWVKMNTQGDEMQYQVHKFRLTFLRITKFFEKVSSLFFFQDSRKRNNR